MSTTLNKACPLPQQQLAPAPPHSFPSEGENSVHCGGGLRSARSSTAAGSTPQRGFNAADHQWVPDHGQAPSRTSALSAEVTLSFVAQCVHIGLRRLYAVPPGRSFESFRWLFSACLLQSCCSVHHAACSCFLLVSLLLTNCNQMNGAERSFLRGREVVFASE